MTSSSHLQYMQRAIELAEEGKRHGEIPVGAVVVLDDQIIGEGFNRSITHADPTAHAEVVALRAAAQVIGNYRLVSCTLYVTLEPCVMCAGAMVHARVSQLIYGASDPKSGAILSKERILDLPFMNHKVKYEGGVLSDTCGKLLSQFFAERR